MTVELKSCPFCGGKAEIQRHKFTGCPDSYGVKCERCKTQGYQFWESEDEAAAVWNRRVDNEDNA